MILQQYGDYGQIVDELQSISNDEDRARTISIHRKGLSSDNLATFTVSTPAELRVSIDVHCHASFGLLNDATYYSSCYDQRWVGDHPAGDAYYEWLTSDDSPYRSLFTHSKPERILPKGGRGGGFILDAKNVKDFPNKWPLYNFMIAMRMVSEESDSIKTWHTMVDFGLHPADALYLSRMFILQEHRGNVYLRKYSNNDGSHWPLSDDTYGSYGKTYHSFRRFREGDMGKAPCGSSEIWWNQAISRKKFVFSGKADETRSNLSLYAPIRIIDAFKEYLKGE